MYEAIVLVHILSGFVWIGGFFLIMGTRRRKGEGAEVAAGHTLGLVERSNTWLFNITPFLVLITGVIQVVMSDAWDFSQLWIILAITLFVVALVIGGGFGERLLKQMRDAEGQTVPALFKRWAIVSWIDMVVLIAIVALMVYKPI